MASPLVAAPTFEHHHDGFGVGHAAPRLSWRFLDAPDTATDWVQTGYTIEITRESDTETFTVDNDGRSVLVPWPATPLDSRESATVRVRCRGRGRRSDAETIVSTESAWSEPAVVEAALLRRPDWDAWSTGSSFITSARRIGPDGPLQPLRFRRVFEVPSSRKIKRARLYVTCLGVCTAYINGRRTSDEVLAPGWTSYQHRINYRVHDVTEMLAPGENKKKNTIAVEVGEGWYAGLLSFRPGERFMYGDRLAALARLEVSFEGGERWALGTDSSWECAPSAIQLSELYNGEVYDARCEDDGEWNGGASSSPPSGTTTRHQLTWEATETHPWPATAALYSPDAPPVRVTETLGVSSVFHSASGKTILDFGQNVVGRVRVRSVDLPAGSSMVLRHAEVMEHGELCTRPLRLAKATDRVVSAGREVRDWAPEFTYHGFQYVEVTYEDDTGRPLDSPPPLESIKGNFAAEVLHTDLRRRGTFACSNTTLTQLHRNVVWSTRGNFVSIPTDCPQRNERLGWTGDIQAFGPTAHFLFDTVGMLSEWLGDLQSEQMEPQRGGVPDLICPSVPMPGWPHMAAAVWDDVTVLGPLDLYHASGDPELLRRQLPGMRAWVDGGVHRGPDGLWDRDVWQLGDWLDPKAPPNDPSNGPTDTHLVADAYLIRTTDALAAVCRALAYAGRGSTSKKHSSDDDDAEQLASRYEADAAALRTAFQHKYLTPAGLLVSNTQTALALALCYSLLPPATALTTAGAELERQVRRARFNIATGFAGTPAVCPALATHAGRPQLAYRMVLEETCPSWCYPVRMGATTTWERWDSLLPDGGVNPGGMTSFNHYALGSVAGWLHGTVAGLAPYCSSASCTAAAAGWRTVLVRPVPGGNLTWAEAGFEGPYGRVATRWWFDDEDNHQPRTKRCFKLQLTVPPNSTAIVILPVPENLQGEKAASQRVVGSGTHIFSCDFEPDEWPPARSIAPHIIPPEEHIAE